MASSLAKLVAPSASYLFTFHPVATASSRFFNTKSIHQDRSEEECNIKHVGPKQSRIREAFSKALCPRLSATRNLTRVLNRMNDIDGFAPYPRGPMWDVTEDDKAIYLVHHIYISPYSPYARDKYVEEFVDRSPYVMKNIYGYFRVYRIPEAIIIIEGSEGPNPGESYRGYFFKMYLPSRIYRSVWDIEIDHVKKEVLKITIPKQKEKWACKITTKFLYISPSDY